MLSTSVSNHSNCGWFSSLKAYVLRKRFVVTPNFNDLKILELTVDDRTSDFYMEEKYFVEPVRHRLVSLGP